MIVDGVPFAQALRFWLKLGFVSFGGPAGQIAIMHRELVERRGWISEARFLHALNYCMLLPGPEAQQLATYIGWLMHGTWGGIAAGALFVLPSLIILIALSWIYLAYGHVAAVSGFLYGIKPAVVALVAFAAWRIGRRTLRTPALTAIAAAAFLAIFILQVPFPVLVGMAALLGALGARFMAGQFALPGSPAHDAPGDERNVATRTNAPAHTRFAWPRLLTCVAIGLALWAAGMVLLALHAGGDGVLTRMGWFFTKAALLTFGGAYAVLPYVFQGAVEQAHWLTAAQMMDGLALGETTPGPLIMVVAFVGYVGGWTHAVLGIDARVAGGVAGAMVATFFTFLPSFLFILAGGPLVEATRGSARFTAPLTAITAAVVGVIVNLGVFFAWKVVWPQATWSLPFAGGFDLFSAGLALLALALLARERIGVIPVILGCGAAGLIKTLSG